MVKERLPITEVVEGVCDHSFGVFSLDRFREHIKPLNIEAKGDVLIIGPGELMEEVALIEPEIAAGQVSSVTMIGSNPVLFGRVIETAGRYNTRFERDGISWGQHFDANKNLLYDVIIYIGTISPHLQEKLKEFSAHLRPKGRLYLTVNGLPPHELPELNHCRVKVIPNIPTNPNYDLIPVYFGVVVEKE